jgi:hypothetical protein
MDRKSVWIVAGAILVGTLLLSLSQAFAQRNFRTESGSSESRAPRYQVVNVTEGEIIIMDVNSGDLYSAKPRDVKPYEARPQPDHFGRSERFEFKDKPDRKDGFPRKDKVSPRFDKSGPPFGDKDKKGD